MIYSRYLDVNNRPHSMLNCFFGLHPYCMRVIKFSSSASPRTSQRTRSASPRPTTASTKMCTALQVKCLPFLSNLKKKNFRNVLATFHKTPKTKSPENPPGGSHTNFFFWGGGGKEELKCLSYSKSTDNFDNYLFFGMLITRQYF